MVEETDTSETASVNGWRSLGKFIAERGGAARLSPRLCMAFFPPHWDLVR